MLRFSALLSLLPGTAAHGWMSHPVAIQPGAADINLQDRYGGPGSHHYRDAASWFTHNTWTEDNPPRAPGGFPGNAQIHGACGIHHSDIRDTECGSIDHMRNPLPYGVTTTATYKKYDEPSYGEERYCDARRYLATATVGARWTAGEAATVSWAVSTNHHGAIGYRLCPFETVIANKNDVGKGGATEQCFQAGHLEFENSKTCIRCPGGSSSTDVCYDAVDVAGQNGNIYRTWDNFVQTTCPDGVSPHDYCAAPTTKTPCTVNDDPAWSLVDRVKVPAGLTGKFVLGFRWDTSGTIGQVWQNCAVVEIVAGSSVLAV